MLTITDPSTYRGLSELSESAVTIGNFDGFHRGHQELARETLTFARATGRAAVAISFDPRPEAWFKKIVDEPLLFAPGQKQRALREAGFDVLLTLNFDAKLAAMTHDEFYDGILCRDLGMRSVAIGHDFRFGHARQGNAAYLTARAVQDANRVVVLPATNWEGSAVSSSRIRKAIAEGRVEDAASMLGRPYALEGILTRGDQLGRTLGFPTMNLTTQRQIVPHNGVYAGWAVLGPVGGPALAPLLHLPKDAIPMVMNIGVRPSVTQTPSLRIEAHMLAGTYPFDSMYGMSATYYPVARLRDEQRFPDLNALQQQIARDIHTARQVLRL